MSIRTFFVVFLAMVCGLSAAIGVMSLRQTTTVVLEKETVSVVVAAVDIARGSLVAEEFLTTRDYAEDAVPSGAVMTIEDAIERAVMIPLLAGEPVLDKKLAGRDQGRGVAPLVRDGMRAYTILTPTPAAAVAGFILPGNRVDVLLTVTSSGRDDPTGGGSTTTLMQNVEVMAVNREIDVPDGAISTESLASVTLQLKPEQVAKLTLAQNRGVLNLSLRNDADQEAGATLPITMADLRYSQQSPQLAISNVDDAPALKLSDASPASNYNLRIRTLRGTAPGQVWLQYAEAAVPQADQLRGRTASR